MPKGNARRSRADVLRGLEAKAAARLKTARKQLGLYNIRAAAKRGKLIAAWLRKNRRQVLEVLQKKNPALYQKFVKDTGAS